MSGWKKYMLAPVKELEIPKPKEAMQTETATLAQYSGVAFRLPSLQREQNERARDTELLPETAHVCPRELRTMAASENALIAKQKRLLLQKSNALMKRKRNAEISKRHSPFSCNPNDIEVQSEENFSLHDTIDAMGFLARELTEVNEAIERNKSNFKGDTLKGLRKVIAAVLHTLRQDQLKTAFNLMDLSNKTKYENITQSVSLSPRILNKAEKREPSMRRPHICKGCKDGGLLPWLYLYPDHEVYRTGGGFDCVEFHLPIVNSEKPVTKPKDPFGKNRGKLADTSMHRLPEKLPTKSTKPAPFNFHRPKLSLEVRLEVPNSEMTNMSPVSKIRFGKRKPELSPVTPDSKLQREFDRDAYLKETETSNTSLETVNMEKDQDTEFGNFTQRRLDTLISVDSGVVTTPSTASEDRIPNKKDSLTMSKELSRPAKLSELNHLRKKLTGYDELGPLKDQKQKNDVEVAKGPKKLVVRRSMSITPSTNDIKSIHNSSLLANNDNSTPIASNGFGVRRKQSLKPVGYRKKLSTIDGGENKVKDLSSTTSTVSDMSVNFSSSLSLGNSQQDVLEEYSEFTLTGSKVIGMKRHSSQLKKRRPSRASVSNRRMSRTSKSVIPIEEESFAPQSLSQRKLSADIIKQDNIKDPKKVKTTEVFVDLYSSMSQEIRSPDSEANETEPTSRVSSCQALQPLDEALQEDDENEVDEKDVNNNYINPQETNDFSVPTSDMNSIERSLTNESTFIGSNQMDIDIDNRLNESFGSIGSEEIDGVDDLPDDGEPLGKKIRKKLRRRKTLKYRNEPLSRYTLKRKQTNETDMYQETEEDMSMLDYAARYCIISLERLSKYENVFSSFATCDGEDNDSHNANESRFESDVVGETEEQRKILKEYEKLIYSMDVYQQKISEAERKRTELKYEKESTMGNVQDLQLDDEKKKLLEKTVQAFSRKITSVDDRIKQFVDNVKNMMVKKRDMEERLRELSMDNETVDKLVKNSDFLGRKFTKLKCLKINVEDLPEALKSFNPNFEEEDFQFINHVLKLPQNESLDFKAFAVVSALTERVKSLDQSIKALLKEVDLGTLERKLDKCKELYRLLSEEHQDGNRTIPLENLLVELQAGGLDRDHQRSVVDKLNHHGHGFVDFLDFVLYIPLFLMIHDQIVSKPFE